MRDGWVLVKSQGSLRDTEKEKGVNKGYTKKKWWKAGIPRGGEWTRRGNFSEARQSTIKKEKIQSALESTDDRRGECGKRTKISSSRGVWRRGGVSVKRRVNITRAGVEEK